MADRTTTKTKNTNTETQQLLPPMDQTTATLNLSPLPNNRPISKNVTEDTDALMGYLD
ncbi:MULTISPECIES: hypothetical protein [unclassified Coleofasciculus]|uniref:hypothetical protein n=1 Tax=unclassified Coleofasciculus TaxID=2692782 RepID=UPI00187EBC58|nr:MULTISPECIES: hypothetical protein [unclassified Coleofasciculus]MBE9126233.1 hypothetical protein [Coleofasciculus sp. LEGE 07081]MBE9148105.1 hypothetical protein [Coleofasciculus sp. LEGE 07092]